MGCLTKMVKKYTYNFDIIIYSNNISEAKKGRGITQVQYQNFVKARQLQEVRIWFV